MSSGVDWSEDVVERVADELVHGFDVVKEAVVAEDVEVFESQANGVELGKSDFMGA